MEDQPTIGSKGKTLTALHGLVLFILYADTSQMCICRRNIGAPYTFQTIKDWSVVKHRNNRKSNANYCH